MWQQNGLHSEVMTFVLIGNHHPILLRDPLFVHRWREERNNPFDVSSYKAQALIPWQGAGGTHSHDLIQP